MPDAGRVLLLCVAPRAAALLWFPPDISALYYWDTSDAFLGRRPLALDDADAAFLEPLYPALLAVLRWLTGDRVALVMLAQAALGAAAGPLLFRFTERLADSRRAAWIAVALYAFDPYLVRQSVSSVEITVCTALLISAAWLFERIELPSQAATAGVLLGLAGLARFSLLPVAVGAAVLLVWNGRSKQAAILTAAAALTLAPWIGWMYATSGTVVPTRIGVNLFVSTNEYSDQVVPTRNADLLVPYAYDVAGRHLDRAAFPADERQRREDNVLLRLALRFARERPLHTVTLKVRNFAYAISPLLLPFERKPQDAFARIEDGVVTVIGLVPRPVYEHALYSASRTILLAGAAVGLLVTRRRRLGDGFLLVTAATVIGVQTVFFPTSRLLAPMAFVLMFYAALAIASYLGNRHTHAARGRRVPSARHEDTKIRRSRRHTNRLCLLLRRTPAADGGRVAA